MVVDGALSAAIGRDVMYYHATYVHPDWHRAFVARIGQHVFFK